MHQAFDPWPHDRPLTHMHSAQILTCIHHSDVIMGAMASQFTSLTIVYSTVYSDAEQRKQQSSASLPFVWGIHRWQPNSPRKWPVTRKCFHSMTSPWYSHEVPQMIPHSLFSDIQILRLGTNGFNITPTCGPDRHFLWLFSEVHRRTV